MIRFRCQECGKKLKADDEIVGRKVKCTRCDNVETVPPCDNLTKPKDLEKRLETTKPKPLTRTSASVVDSENRDAAASDSSADESLFDDLVLDDLVRPIEMVSSNPDAVSVVQTDRPGFRQFERKRRDLKRLLPFGLVGFATLIIILTVVNSGWLFGGGPRYPAEFESLPAVANYRRAQNQLEKSRRVMMVIGEALISQKSSPTGMVEELEDFNESILSLSRKITTLDEAYELTQQDSQAAANKLLTDEANLMDDRKFDVERKTEEYNKLTYEK